MAKGDLSVDNAIDRRKDSPNAAEQNSDQKPIPARSLAEFREIEGRSLRKERLHALWQQICNSGYLSSPQDHPPALNENDNEKSKIARTNTGLSADNAEQLRAAYEAELFGRCGAQSSKKQIGWEQFKSYALAKEAGTTICIISFLFCRSILP